MQCEPTIPDKSLPYMVKAGGLNLYTTAVSAFHEDRLAALDARFKEGTGLFEGPSKDRAAHWWIFAKVDAKLLRDRAREAGIEPAVYEAMIKRSVDAAKVAAASVRPGEKPDRKQFYPWV